MAVLVADFETTANDENKNSARVWSYEIMDLKYNTLNKGIDLDGFMNFIKNKSNTIWFHNAKFDTSYIFPYLLKNNFKQLSHDEVEKYKYKKNSFSTILDEMGNFYMLKIYWKKERKGKNRKSQWLITTIKDSYKLLPMSLKKMSTDYLELPYEEQKGSIDYEMIRPIGYQPTNEEWEYQHKDVKILAMGINKALDMGMDKMTVSANAFSEFLRIKFNNSKERYRRLLPVLTLEEDDFVRKSYHGGWTYTNPKYKGLRNKGLYGCTYDVNSLYPFVMSNNIFPCGQPVYYEGKYKKDKRYPLYIQKFHVQMFKLKDRKFPTLQFKNNSRFVETEYLESGSDVVLTMTNIDLEDLKERYHLEGVTYICGYKFMAVDGLFKEYVEYYGNMKKSATNKTIRTNAKLMLNSLYGKFASKIRRLPMQLYLDKNNIVRKQKLEDEEYAVTPYYTPIGAFITSYARRYTVQGADKNYDNFYYADTDSLSLRVKSHDEVRGINIDYNKTGELGLWDREIIFTESLYLGAKKYMKLDIDGNYEVKCAGLPQEVKDNIKCFDDFYIGAKFEGKKTQRVVEGGTLILSSTFTIKK